MAGRIAARVDKNHAEIVRGLRQAGLIVHDTSRLGGGFPDLVVLREGHAILLEVKTAKGKLTKDEKEFFDTWQGGPVYIVRSVEEALQIMGLMA